MSDRALPAGQAYRRVQTLRRLAQAAQLGLTAWLWIDAFVFDPPASAAGLLAGLVLCVPALLLALALLRGGRQAYFYSLIGAMVYFAWGISEAFLRPAAPLPGQLTLTLALAWFIAAAFYVRAAGPTR